MQLRDKTDIAASARIEGNDCLRANLEIFSRPDDARVDCPGGLSLLPAIEWRFNGKLNVRVLALVGIATPMTPVIASGRSIDRPCGKSPRPLPKNSAGAHVLNVSASTRLFPVP